ncbi:MAG: lipoyl(octanoyl) transferase LipB [Opitutaceae bacterium]|nr:lipoyl(octanoyl) transferase LipB [Opitutaceae bacterium]
MAKWPTLGCAGRSRARRSVPLPWARGSDSIHPSKPPQLPTSRAPPTYADVHNNCRQVTLEDWGRTHYDDALARQLAMLEQRLDGARGDTLVFTEHEPVFTLGLHPGADAHLLWNEHQLQAAGIAVKQSNRGGDITYHGPGQLVAYPIVSLEPQRDLHAYLRLLEDVLIDTVASFGLTGVRRHGKTGIWIGNRKIAAIGVAARRWIAYHGIALNVSPDLAHFAGIIPCGIDATEGSVTSLALEGVTKATLESAKTAFAAAFIRRWTA